jgi:vesicle-associated membrane protein 7
MFMCMCDEAYGRSKPFLFLKEIIETYFLMFSGEETVLEGSTARGFKGVLLQKIKNFSDPPATSLSAQLSTDGTTPDPAMSKMKQAKATLDSVATSAKENLQKLIDRNHDLDGLMDKTTHMRDSGIQFSKASRKLNRRLCWENYKLKVLMGLVIFVSGTALSCY